jgi:hypothetical protein
MGSGTTAVACVNTDRHFIGYELAGLILPSQIGAYDRALLAIGPRSQVVKPKPLSAVRHRDFQLRLFRVHRFLIRLKLAPNVVISFEFPLNCSRRRLTRRRLCSSFQVQ